MKFLGIDYGTKRVGLALSDERGVLAFPHTILQNSPNLILDISKVIEQNEVTEIIVGLSLDTSGTPNQVAKKIEEFISRLKTLDLPVYREKEFFTSVEARRVLSPKLAKNADKRAHNKQKSKDSIDDKSATLILQRFLDKRNQ